MRPRTEVGRNPFPISPTFPVHGCPDKSLHGPGTRLFIICYTVHAFIIYLCLALWSLIRDAGPVLIKRPYSVGMNMNTQALVRAGGVIFVCYVL